YSLRRRLVGRARIHQKNAQHHNPFQVLRKSTGKVPEASFERLPPRLAFKMQLDRAPDSKNARNVSTSEHLATKTASLALN
ncbi:MAG: hypothetical protein ACLTQI_05215, partial [Slackia sp.]